MKYQSICNYSLDIRESLGEKKKYSDIPISNNQKQFDKDYFDTFIIFVR